MAGTAVRGWERIAGSAWLRAHGWDSSMWHEQLISRRIYIRQRVRLLGKGKIELFYQGILLSYLLYYIAIPPAALQRHPTVTQLVFGQNL